MDNKNTLVYDIFSVPHRVNIEEVIYLFKQHKIVIYDGTRGFEPRIENGDGTIKFYDSRNVQDKKEFDKIVMILNEECRD